MKLKNSLLVISLIIFISSIIVYLPSLKNDFVWDDEEVIENSHFTFKASSIKDILIPKQNVDKKSKYYRPLHYSSIVFDKTVWGINSFGFHLTNILIHALNSLLVFYLFRLVLKEFKIKDPEINAFVGSLFFILHPIHTESVSWVAGRTDTLCTVFFLAAFIFHIKIQKRRIFITIALFTYFLSLLSKELAIAFPLVILCFEYLTNNLKRKNILVYCSYFIITLIYLYLRGRAFVNIPEVEYISKNAADNTSLLIYFEPIKILFNSYFFYIYKLLFPFELNAFISSVPVDTFYTLSSFVTITLITILVFYYGIKKHSLLLFSFLFFVLTLGPSATVALSNIAATPLAERYLYLPSVGFIFILVYLINQLKVRLKGNLNIIIISLLSVFYLFICIDRQAIWKNSLTLWQDTSKKSYTSPIVHTNYGSALLEAGMYEKAITELYIALSPEFNDTNRGRAVTSINLGNTYIALENYPLAEKWFIEANRYDPHYGRTYYQLGLINYIKAETTGNKVYYKTAEKHLIETFKYYYSYSKAHLLLSNVYLGLGDKEKAKKQAEIALNIGLPGELSKKAEYIIKIDNNGRGKNP
ncbi:MAG TPA: tetratricopeptide repeat protein [Thermodesulfobacteriota bacterium]|nr:tetratricopeptide repeat protein [Thermodesulfobacteriota bacterium]